MSSQTLQETSERSWVVFVRTFDAVVVQAAMLAPANACVWVPSLEVLDLLSEAFDLALASRGRRLAHSLALLQRRAFLGGRARL